MFRLFLTFSQSFENFFSPIHVNSFIHPPLSSLPYSILSCFLGVNNASYIISHQIVIYSFLYFFARRFGLKRLHSILSVYIISFLPVLEDLFLVIDMANYYLIFFLFLIISYQKMDLKYLCLVVGVSLLFRSTCIVFLIFPITKAITQNVKINKETCLSFLPILICLPIFLKQIIFGTPTTADINYKIFNYSELVKIFFNYKAVIGLCFLSIILVYKHDKMSCFFLIFISFTYFIMLSLTNQPIVFKYVLELLGALMIMVLFLTFKFKKVLNFLFLFLLCSILPTLVNRNNKENFVNYNQTKKNNRTLLINKYHDEISRTLIIDKDYQNFSKLLHYSSFSQLEKFCNYQLNYEYLKNKKYNFPYSKLDTNIIKDLGLLPKNIVILDGLYSKDSYFSNNNFFSRYYKIDTLIKENKFQLTSVVFSLKIPQINQPLNLKKENYIFKSGYPL